MNILFMVLGVIIGFLATNFLAGKSENKIGAFILLMKTKHHTYHLHHWIVTLFVMIFLFLFSFHNYFLYGILTGVMVQGLTYKDWHKIIVKRKHKIR